MGSATRRGGPSRLSLGLRQGEALGLQWKDIDLEVGTLRVRRAAQRQVGRGIVFVEPKSAAGRRTISLPHPLTEALREQRAAQDAEREKAADLWQDFDLIFAQPNGRPIEPRVDYGRWKRLLKKAGVRQVRLHDARHTAASLLQVRGIAFDASFDGFGDSLFVGGGDCWSARAA